eukprot:scaffold31974_cov62-Cyclotella_meneghiniana.AAC.1
MINEYMMELFPALVTLFQAHMMGSDTLPMAHIPGRMQTEIDGLEVMQLKRGEHIVTDAMENLPREDYHSERLHKYSSGRPGAWLWLICIRETCQWQCVAVADMHGMIASFICSLTITYFFIEYSSGRPASGSAWLICM